MIREIKKKMVILGNRMPFDEKAKSYFGDIEKKDWVYTNMQLEGTALSRAQIEALMAGEFMLEASVGDHLMAERMEQLLDKMYESAAKGWALDLHLLAEFRGIIAGETCKAEEGYRRRNTMMVEYDYMPVLPSEIPSAMLQLQLYILHNNHVPAGSMEAFETAVAIHNRLIEIQPYGEGDKVLARAAMIYYLLLRGYPAGLPEIKETEYNELVYNCLKKGDSKALVDGLLNGILARLELMIRLTAY